MDAAIPEADLVEDDWTDEELALLVMEWLKSLGTDNPLPAPYSWRK